MKTIFQSFNLVLRRKGEAAQLNAPTRTWPEIRASIKASGYIVIQTADGIEGFPPTVLIGAEIHDDSDLDIQGFFCGILKGTNLLFEPGHRFVEK